MFKKRQRLSQFLGLGSLFIIAASFFAVQLYSEEGASRGIALALQPPPVMPPAYRVRPVALPEPDSDSGFMEVVDFGVEVESKAGATQETEGTQKAKAKPETGATRKVEGTQKAEVEIVEPPVEVVVEVASVELSGQVSDDGHPAKRVKTEKSPKKSAQNAKQEKTRATKVEKTSLVVPEVALGRFVEAPPMKEEISSVGSVQAVVPVSAVAVVECIPTEIPPEWNWFNQPLKMEMSEGRVAIVAIDESAEAELAADEKNAIPCAGEGSASRGAPETEETDLVVAKPVIEDALSAHSPALEPELGHQTRPRVKHQTKPRVKHQTKPRVKHQTKPQLEPFQEAIVKLRKARADRLRREQVRHRAVEVFGLAAVRPSMSMMRVRDYLRYMESASAYERALVTDFNPVQEVGAGASSVSVLPAASGIGTKTIAGVHPYRAESGSTKTDRFP